MLAATRSRGALELLFLWFFAHEVYSEDVQPPPPPCEDDPNWVGASYNDTCALYSNHPGFCGNPDTDASGVIGSVACPVACHSGCFLHEYGDTPCWYDQSTDSVMTCASDEPQDSRFCTNGQWSDAEWSERVTRTCFDKVSCGCTTSSMCWYDQATGNIRICTGDMPTVDYYVCMNADRLSQRCFDKASCGCSDGLLYADVDCAGAWSACTVDCRRTWIQSVAQSGRGQACPIREPRCQCGDDECPPEPDPRYVSTRCAPAPPPTGRPTGGCPPEQLPTETPLQPLTVPCWYDQSTESIRTCAFDEPVDYPNELCTNGNGLAQRCFDRASCGCRGSSYRQPCWYDRSTGYIRTCAFDEPWDSDLCTNGDTVTRRATCFDKASCECPGERRRAQESAAPPAAPPPAAPPPAAPPPTGDGPTSTNGRSAPSADLSRLTCSVAELALLDKITTDDASQQFFRERSPRLTDGCWSSLYACVHFHQDEVEAQVRQMGIDVDNGRLAYTPFPISTLFAAAAEACGLDSSGWTGHGGPSEPCWYDADNGIVKTCAGNIEVPASLRGTCGPGLPDLHGFSFHIDNQERCESAQCDCGYYGPTCNDEKCCEWTPQIPHIPTYSRCLNGVGLTERCSDKVSCECPVISLGADAKPPSQPSPPSPPDSDGGSGATVGYVVVLLLLGGAMYVVKDKALGPFAPKDASLVSGAGGASGDEPTMYESGGDDTL